MHPRAAAPPIPTGGAAATKSAILFVLVLVVCALFLGQAALASVRSRHVEIGTLRCLAWSAPAHLPAVD